jgi:glutathione S-transferase
MASIKSITLWGHTGGPNPWKVAMVLEELNVPYKIKFLELPEMKQPAYEKININGRVPAIEDPNTGITLWESGAIIEYLVETYDKERKMSFATGTTEYFHAKQWLHFQVSGQGPYFGQAVWFKVYHPEQIQSAQDRYINEMRRVSSVLNRALEGREWLVGCKYTYADVAFVMWFEFVPWVAGEKIDILKEFPNLHAWLDKMRNRPAVAKVIKARADVNEKK